MSKYETTFILDPSIGEEKIEGEIKRVSDFIEGHKAKILKSERWGMRRLSYPIAKKNQGYYVFMLYEGENNIPRELERFFLLNESCIRFLTVKSEAEYTPEPQPKEKNYSSKETDNSK
ncbi:MAG: 30S ribosomal protein S6 [Candidatus Zixiibacteriota bacterium]